MDWPLNLILSKRAMTKYQLIFRHLFFCKAVELQLMQAWHLHQHSKELNIQVQFSISNRNLGNFQKILLVETQNASVLQELCLLYAHRSLGTQMA